MSTRSLRHGLFAIAFLVALMAPLLDLAVDLLPDPPLVENRRPAPLPAASALLDDPVGTVRAAAAAFRDRFGGRADRMTTGFPGEAGPRKGADRTIAGSSRRAPRRIVWRAAGRQASGSG